MKSPSVIARRAFLFCSEISAELISIALLVDLNFINSI